MKFEEILPLLLRGDWFVSKSNIYKVQYQQICWKRLTGGSWKDSVLTFADMMGQDWQPYEEPKPKIKRWLWIAPNGTTYTTYRTEEEAKHCLGNVRKLLWSEEEFDS